MTAQPAATPAPRLAPPIRPRSISILFCLMVLFALTGFYSHWLAMTGQVTGPAAELIRSWSTLDWVLPWITTTLLLLGAVALHRERAYAFVVVVVYTIVVALQTVLYAITSDWLKVYGWQGVALAGAGLLASGALAAYLWRLKRQGVLR